MNSPLAAKVGRLRQVAAREAHRRGIYRLGGQPFGAIDRSLWLERLDIDLVIDVGANVGGYSALLRERGYRGRIISMEPSSQPFATLRDRVVGDARWTAHNVGIGEVDAVQTLHVANNMTSSSFLDTTDRFHASHDDVEIVRQEEIQMRRLDSFADDVPTGARTWLKLDIEGLELPAIRGGRELLARTTCVEVEMTTHRQYGEEALFFEVAAALYEEGFELEAVQSAVTAPSGRTIRFDGLFTRGEA